ncbi:MAG: low molecular weight phosphotyrosine protein phosphatase [Burkholderiales bacterium]|nr:MAG: low molecular weight phosphotyrosine protein phosphatase [Burkholderiales bacterium]
MPAARAELSHNEPMPNDTAQPAAPTYRVLFVCMGNICRSPTAHGVFEARVRQAGLAAQVQVDSAGTHGYHIGAPPDARSQRHALRRGYDLSEQRSRQLKAADFDRFDLVLAMDWDNLALAEELCPPHHRRKLRRFAEFFQRFDQTVVPDPYTGGPAGFELVLDLVEDGSEGLLAHVRRELNPSGSGSPSSN